jgi:hypothetical protein
MILQAQAVSPPVPLDSRVRVTINAYTGPPVIGNVEAWDEQSIELERPGFAPMAIELSDIAKLEISRGERNHLLWGALIGAGIGVGVNALFVSLDEAEGISVVFVGLGAGLGALVGALIRTEKWQDVPLLE